MIPHSNEIFTVPMTMFQSSCGKPTHPLGRPSVNHYIIQLMVAELRHYNCGEGSTWNIHSSLIRSQARGILILTVAFILPGLRSVKEERKRDLGYTKTAIS